MKIDLPKEKMKIILKYPFIDKYFKGKLDSKMYWEGLEEFKHQLIKEGLAEEDIEKLKYVHMRCIAKGYKLLQKSEVDEHKRVFAEILYDIHMCVSPDMIILLDTAATPFGFAMKEAWREAYPEKKPFFLKLDPHYLYVGRKTDKRNIYKETKFLKEITKFVKNKDSVILIYDETSSQYDGLNIWEDVFIDNPDTKSSNTGLVGRLLWSEGFKNLWCYAGGPISVTYSLPESLLRPTTRVPFLRHQETDKIRASSNLTDMSRKYIHDLRKLGKEVGKLSEEERKKIAETNPHIHRRRTEEQIRELKKRAKK